MGVFKVNRASFIEVKNRIFGIDPQQSAQLTVSGKLIDSLTYALITVFRVMDHYSQNVSQHALTEFRGQTQNLETLKKKTDLLRQSVLRTSGLLIARKNKITHHATRGDLGGQQLNHELKRMAVGLLSELGELMGYIEDLVLLSCCVERDCFLDMFKYDIVILKCKIGSSVQSLSHYLTQFTRFPGRQLDNKMFDIRSTEIFEYSKQLRSILRENSLLILLFQQGKVAMTDFLIKRNELSLKYIDLSPDFEKLLGEPPVYVSDSQFLYTISTDALKITETLTMHFSHALNTVQSSTEFFFKLSNLIEVDLYILTSTLRSTQSPDFAQLTSLLLRLETILNTSATLTAESISYKEFRIDELLFRETVNKTHQLRVCVQILIKIFSLRAQDMDADEKCFQIRFSTLVESMNLCTMGLGESVGKYVDKL